MNRSLLLVACLLLGTAGPALARADKEPDLISRLKKVKGPFGLIVSFRVKTGEESAMLAAAAPCITASRKEAGCKRYELHQDLEDPTRFVFIETWGGVKDIESHLAQPYTKKLLGTVGKIAVAPPRIRITTGSK